MESSNENAFAKIGEIIMIFRTQDEIKRKSNKMEPQSYRLTSSNATIRLIQDEAFESGYKQAVKEMKEYFNIKANGVHTRYEE